MVSVIGIAGADYFESDLRRSKSTEQQCAAGSDRIHSDFWLNDPQEEKLMSSKVNIAAVAALLVACVAPVAAYAQSHNFTTLMPVHKPHVPANAHGSVAASDVFSGPAVRSGERWSETDPDPRIRFEMIRDDRDRRAL